MANSFVISIVLDTRRAKNSGKYPVKLRVFMSSPKTQKYYPTVFEFSKAEFSKVWEAKKLRKEHKELRLQLQNLEFKANEMARRLSPFTLDKFEQQLYGIDKGNSIEVSYYYAMAINRLQQNDQIRTASSYELSLKSLQNFHGKKKLTFLEIDPAWLKRYERYMQEDLKRSPTTVGIYLRPLRAIFNDAIADKVIDKDDYPFGKRRYTIPAPKGTKRALSKEQLKILFEAVPEKKEHAKAKAFWFFSYASNGINFKDIANLKFKDISGDVIYFTREKTKNTSKSKAPVSVYMNSFIKQVIEEYGKKKRKPDDYIFPILSPKATPKEKLRQLSNFIRLVNQHFKNFALSLGIDENVSTYWARHSFATNAIRSGASMEFVSEALSHSSLNTTKNYFAGFESEAKKEFSKKMMEF
jgi:integrase/recombinase XerD